MIEDWQIIALLNCFLNYHLTNGEDTSAAVILEQLYLYDPELALDLGAEYWGDQLYKQMKQTFMWG